MSDSGRQIGDCEHANRREWCVHCLRVGIERLRSNAAKTLATLGEPESVDPVFALYAVAIGYRAEIERLTAENEKLSDDCLQLQDRLGRKLIEIERLKRGEFTPAEYAEFFRENVAK